MTAGTKSATIQVRVMPLVKETSEEVLWRIGLSMSDAVELFLRRAIVDQRIPFEVVAVQNLMISGFPGDRPKGDPLTGETTIRSTLSRGQSEDQKWVPPEKRIEKVFRRSHAIPSSIKNEVKKGKKFLIFLGVVKYGFTPPYGCRNSTVHSPGNRR
jgi:addiction module RelB/DinJ family antitoxin